MRHVNVVSQDIEDDLLSETAKEKVRGHSPMIL